MDNQKWLTAYRTNKEAVWIKCKLTNGEEFYYDHFDGWHEIKQKCENDSLFIEELFLQFRSHEVSIEVGEEGVYLVRSLLGQVGAESKNYYTTGIITGDFVDKKMWLIPELVVDKEYRDTLDECFEEAIIYNCKSRTKDGETKDGKKEDGEKTHQNRE